MVSSVPYHKVHPTEGRPRRQLGARAAARRDLRPRGEWPYVGAGEELPGDGDRTSDRDRGGQELGEGGRGREGLGRRCQPKPKNDLAIFTEKRVEKERKCLEEHQRNALSSGGTGASGAVPQSEVPDGPCVSRASRALSVVHPQPGGAEPSVSIGTKFPGRSQGLWVGRRPSSSAERLRGGRQPPPPN